MGKGYPGLRSLAPRQTVRLKLTFTSALEFGGRCSYVNVLIDGRRSVAEPEEPAMNWRRAGSIVAAVVIAAGLVSSPGAASAAPNNVVTKPPMGWASWNTFAAKINYSVLKGQVDALVSSGLKDAGYQYVNIDEGWWQGTRDASGNITVDTAEWPGGMAAVAD